MSLAAAIGRARARLPRRLTLSLRGLMGLVALLALAFALETQVRHWRALARRAANLDRLASEELGTARTLERGDVSIEVDAVQLAPTIQREVEEDSRSRIDTELRSLAARLRSQASDHAAQARELRRRWW